MGSEDSMLAIEARSIACQKRRQQAETEQIRLFASLRGFGSADMVEPFIGTYSSLRRSDRIACAKKLAELQDGLKLEKGLRMKKLEHFYEVTGAGAPAFIDFCNSIGSRSQTASGWLCEFDLEYERMHSYMKSLTDVLPLLEDLHALLMEGSRFAEAKKVGEVSNVHFLEEDKFNKLLARRYPGMREGLVNAIMKWEHDNGCT